MIEMKEVRKTYDTFQFAMSMEIPGGRITGLVGKTEPEKYGDPIDTWTDRGRKWRDSNIWKRNTSAHDGRKSTNWSITCRIWFQQLFKYCGCKENIGKNVSEF